MPSQSGHAMPSCATIALRMNSLLLRSLLSKSARSFSTLKATTAVLPALRGARVFCGMRPPVVPWWLNLQTSARNGGAQDCPHSHHSLIKFYYLLFYTLHLPHARNT